MRFHHGAAQRLEKDVLLHRPGIMVRLEARRHVAHDRLGRDARRLPAVGVAPDSVRDQRDRRPPLPAQWEPIHVGETRRVDDHLGVHRAGEEVILVLRPLLSRVCQPEKVDLVVADALTLMRVGGEHLGDLHRASHVRLACAKYEQELVRLACPARARWARCARQTAANEIPCWSVRPELGISSLPLTTPFATLSCPRQRTIGARS